MSTIEAYGVKGMLGSVYVQPPCALQNWRESPPRGSALGLEEPGAPQGLPSLLTELTTLIKVSECDQHGGPLPLDTPQRVCVCVSQAWAGVGTDA